MRLNEKIAIVIGAGQSPGEGIGNGRATCLRFAQEGATVLAVDNRLSSAAETAELVGNEGGKCVPWEADVTQGGDSGGRGCRNGAPMGPRRYIALQCRLELERR